MLLNVKMPTIVGILTFVNWLSFITSGPSSVWTIIEDVCAYIYMTIRLTKITCAGPNYESIRTLSYSFISTLDPSGPEHQQIYSSLRATE